MVITQILSATFNDIKNKFFLYIKHLLLPFIIIVLFDLYSDSITLNLADIELVPATDETPAVTININDFFSSLVGFIIYIYFELNLAFLTHKITLGKQDDISIIDGLFWRIKHIPFIKAFLLLGVIFCLIVFPLMLLIFIFPSTSELFSDGNNIIPTIILFTLLSPAFYLLSRLSLIAPAAAANSPLKLSQSFSLTKGYGWVITITTFLLPMIIDTFLDLFPSTLFIILINVSLVFSIVLLTNCYKHIKKAKLETIKST